MPERKKQGTYTCSRYFARNTYTRCVRTSVRGRECISLTLVRVCAQGRAGNNVTRGKRRRKRRCVNMAVESQVPFGFFQIRGGVASI